MFTVKKRPVGCFMFTYKQFWFNSSIILLASAIKDFSFCACSFKCSSFSKV